MMKRIWLPLFSILLFFSCQQEPKEVNIWLVGDSTMAAKKPERLPESGWGEGLKLFVKPNVTVHNHAASGRSTLSFITENRWQEVLDSLQADDYVIIQFGHNDQKPDSARHTEPYEGFQDNIQKFIDESKAKGAVPLVCSSIIRRHFDAEGNLIDTHGDYIPAAEAIAKETHTPYVDMEALTHDMAMDLGPEKTMALWNFTEHKQDSTHVSVQGAEVVARLFVENAKAQDLPIAKSFK